MGQYDYVVEQQRLLLEAEEWAKGVKSVHMHSLSSMHYDDRPEDTENGAVTDKEFNSGIVERYQTGKLIHTFGTPLKGSDLVQEYKRNT